MKTVSLPTHLTDNERGALAALVTRLQKWFGNELLQVALFGSKARGNFDDESDLDVLIVIRPVDKDYMKARRQIMDGTYDLELDYDVVFSFLIEDEQGYARMRQWDMLIKRNIERDGIVLWTSLQIWMDRAVEDLATAKELLRLSRWRAAVNRAYYAAFHVASAVLLWLDVERNKHAAVEAAFNQLVIKPGIIEVEYGRFYREARKWREEQHYSELTTRLDGPTAKQIVAEAERFVARLGRYLREEGAIS
jgi:uncharacterized protein (UPF0332 family)/predicted nucleotidyltransferase